MTEGLAKAVGEFLKARLDAKVICSLALAAVFLLSLNAHHVLSLPSNWWLGIAIGCVVCWCISLVNFVSWLWNATQGFRDSIKNRAKLKQEKKNVEKALAYLTPSERNILACLLKRKQKVFQIRPDGEEARTLFSKKFVVFSPGQPRIVHRDTTAEIPDHVWDVLIEHESEFTYRPMMNGNVEVSPWRTPWMAR